nr:DUF3667 domain-containing protein [Winogradskyella alexanderae]
MTPKILARQVNEEFLSIDNKFLKTLLALITKPEDVIEGYIAGLRKRYIGVIPFYAISLTVLGFQMFLLKNFFPEFIEAQDNLFMSGFNFGSQGTAQPPPDSFNFFNDYQGVLFSILMPFLAIGTWVVYLDKKKHNYTEHLVINLYLTAQTIYFSFLIYLLLAAFNVQNYLVASMLVTPPLLLYGAYVFSRIYKSTYIKSLVRYIAAYTIYMIVFSAIMVVILAILFAYLFATGKFNP